MILLTWDHLYMFYEAYMEPTIKNRPKRLRYKQPHLNDLIIETLRKNSLVTISSKASHDLRFPRSNFLIPTSFTTVTVSNKGDLGLGNKCRPNGALYSQQQGDCDFVFTGPTSEGSNWSRRAELYKREVEKGNMCSSLALLGWDVG